MAGDQDLQSRLGALEDAVTRLQLQVSELSRGRPPRPGTAKPASVAMQSAPVATQGQQFGLGDRLAGAAVLCMVLVFALVLRQATESAWISPAAGPVWGLGYCALLFVLSVVLNRSRPMIGRLLSFSALCLGLLIVLETYYRREAVSLGVAQATMTGLALAAVLVGWRTQSGALAGVGLVAASWLAALMDLKTCQFSSVALGLTAGQLVAVVLQWKKGWGWPRWPLLFLTQIFLLLWALALHRNPVDTPRLAGHELMFVLVSLPLVLSAVVGGLRGKAALSVVDVLAPCLGLGAALAMQQWGAGVSSPLVGFLCSLVLLGAGVGVILQKDRSPATGACFLVAGVVMAAWWWPRFIAPAELYVPLLALLGPALVWLSQRAKQKTPRLLGHLTLAGMTLVMLADGSIMEVPSTHGVVPILLSLLVGAIGCLQYRWCLRHPWPADAPRSRLDPNDRLCLLSLAAGCVALLSALRAAGFEMLGPERSDAFQFYQSFCASLLVAGLVVLALVSRLSDLLLAALVALALVSCKVLLYDLFTLPGAYAICLVLTVAAVLALTSIGVQRRRPV